ncbi:MAG: hypothetical protein ABSF03_23645 [Streptosporangiaceae bacterium]|jgi:hypothetical protein
MTAPVRQTVRPLPVVLAEAGRIDCPLCRAKFGPCVTGGLGTTGQHVARCGAAYRAELITEAEMLLVTRIAQVFTSATVVFTSGGAR